MGSGAAEAILDHLLLSNVCLSVGEHRAGTKFKAKPVIKRFIRGKRHGVNFEMYFEMHLGAFVHFNIFVHE